LHESLLNKNVVIEVAAEGFQEFKTYYHSSLRVMVNEAFGELKVTHGKQAQGKIYCKVFAQYSDGREEFFRDGYTDIRGKFEFATASGEGLSEVKKFAVLV
jgi:hypothetical protein